MRIGIDARFYGPLGKGLGRYTEKLITYLERIADDTNTYVVFLRHENFDEYQPTNPRFTKVVADYPWYGWAEQCLFPILIRRQRLDLMHFPHFNVPIFLRERFIVTIHDLILLHFPTVKASELPPFLYWLKYLAYRVVIALAVWRARAIVTVSGFTKKDIEATYRAARGKTFTTFEAADPFCYWMPPDVERGVFRRLGLLEIETTVDPVVHTKPFVLYVGNAYPHKNLQLLLEVAPHFPETTFLCVGKADFFYRSFQEQVVAARAGNIHFPGYVDDRTLGALYRRASTYLFPSLYEGFGLPGLEAMNYGTPVVAARAGSLPEVYAEGAVYFDPSDVDACRQSIIQAFEEGERTDRQRLAFAQVAQFSWRNMARETLRLYNREAMKKLER